MGRNKQNATFFRKCFSKKLIENKFLLNDE